MRFRKLRARDTRPAAPAVREERDSRKRRHSRFVFLLLVGVAVFIALAYWFWSSQWIITRGRVVASTVAIAATKTGRLSELLVTEGESVLAGQVVARLDNAELEARRKEAEAKLAEIQIELAALREMGVNPDFEGEVLAAESDKFDAEGDATNVRARIAALRLDLRQARLNRDRAERLYLLKAITRPEWESAESNHRSLVAEVHVLETGLQTATERAQRVGEQLKVAETNLSREQRAHVSRVDELEQQVVQATERVAAIKASFELNEIVASRDGIVTWIYAEPGEVVDHNDTLITLVDESERWIEAYVEADDLSYVQGGQTAKVSFSGLVGGTYDGRVVEYVSRYENLKTKPRVGPDQVRTPLRLGRVAHPVRITVNDPLPPNIRQEMIASVRIRK